MRVRDEAGPDFDTLEAAAEQVLAEVMRPDLSAEEASRTTHRVVFPDRLRTPGGCLVARQKDGRLLVIVLNAGANLVGRGTYCDFAHSRSLLSGLLEGAQWRFSVERGTTTVQDVGSTNGSILLSTAVRAAATKGLPTLMQEGVGEPIGWDGKTAHDQPRRILPGEVLVTIYSPLLFWLSDGGG